MLSASTAGLLRECQFGFRPEVPKLDGPRTVARETGTGFHDLVDTYASQGVVLPTDDIEIASMFAHAKKWIDAWPDDGAGRASEAPFAWDPVSDRGWSLAAMLRTIYGDAEIPHRAYTDADTWAKLVAMGVPSTAIPMTIDLLEGSHVYDWCTGRTDKAAQLEMNALAVARAFNLDSVTVTTLRIDAAGLTEEGTRTLDAFDLGALAEEFRMLVEAIPTSEPRSGMHCTRHYCKAIDACPAVRKLQPDMIPPSLLARGRTSDALAGRWKFTAALESPEHAAALIPLVKLAEAFVKGVKGAIEEMADAMGGVPIGPGLVWAKGTRHVGRFDAKLATALLKQLGATGEQIAALTKPREESAGYREKKVKP